MVGVQQFDDVVGWSIVNCSLNPNVSFSLELFDFCSSSETTTSRHARLMALEPRRVVFTGLHQKGSEDTCIQRIRLSNKAEQINLEFFTSHGGKLELSAKDISLVYV